MSIILSIKRALRALAMHANTYTESWVVGSALRTAIHETVHDRRPHPEMIACLQFEIEMRQDEYPGDPALTYYATALSFAGPDEEDEPPFELHVGD